MSIFWLQILCFFLNLQRKITENMIFVVHFFIFLNKCPFLFGISKGSGGLNFKDYARGVVL